MLVIPFKSKLGVDPVEKFLDRPVISLFTDFPRIQTQFLTRFQGGAGIPPAHDHSFSGVLDDLAIFGYRQPQIALIKTVERSHQRITPGNDLPLVGFQPGQPFFDDTLLQ